LGLIVSPFQGLIFSIALVTQGVALGYIVPAFQAVGWLSPTRPSASGSSSGFAKPQQ
jgi:hypothetical protein